MQVIDEMFSNLRHLFQIGFTADLLHIALTLPVIHDITYIIVIILP